MPALGDWKHVGYTQQIHFGTGEVDKVGTVLRDLGLRRVLLVTTEGRSGSADGDRVRRSIGRALVETFAGVRSHVPTTAVQEAVRLARREGIDGIVSFGGGSCADLGKAVCFFLEQESGAPGSSYADRPTVMHVSIPTTYSGAELTSGFGMTDEAARSKTGAGGPTIAPIAAIYDPDLTRSTPPRVSAETGMNCLAHGVEAAWSPYRTPEAEAIALSCVERVADALPRVVASPDDLGARNDMLIAAVLGGRCLHNATMGVHHGLSQLLGGRTGIPHGLANALVLPHAIRFNAEECRDEVRRIGRALGDEDDPAGAVERLRDAIGLPSGLSDCGVEDDDLAAVSRLSQANRSVQQNPRPVSEADAMRILESAW
ncbi:MAG TPA: iron-containing alcohol dehydrogenase family protein [Acidimicrobiales bacterium]|nr:iron-containing alcohol dehydrogenase family protein [Acidimicrobiales bacterium]